MTLRARLQRSPLLGFFALTFAWSWACWALSPAIRPQLPWLQAAACTHCIAFGPFADQKVLTVQGVIPRASLIQSMVRRP